MNVRADYALLASLSTPQLPPVLAGSGSTESGNESYNTEHTSVYWPLKKVKIKYRH